MSNTPTQADNAEVEYFEAEVETEEYEGVAAEKLEEAEVSPEVITTTTEIVISDPASSELKLEPENLSNNAPSSVPTETENLTQAAREEDRANLFRSGTITLLLQLLPDDGDAAGRPVLLAVRHAKTTPDYLMLRETDLGHLPLPLQSMLGRLKTRLATPLPPASSNSSGQISQTIRSNTAPISQDSTSTKANEGQGNKPDNSSINPARVNATDASTMETTKPAKVNTEAEEAYKAANSTDTNANNNRSKQLSLFD